MIPSITSCAGAVCVMRLPDQAPLAETNLTQERGYTGMRERTCSAQRGKRWIRRRKGPRPNPVGEAQNGPALKTSGLPRIPALRT